MTNVILRRYGLQPSRINFEGEDKEKYIESLYQIDRNGNYEPLTKLIAESVFSTYKKISDVQRRQIKIKKEN